jgi:hypothetical protein
MAGSRHYLPCGLPGSARRFTSCHRRVAQRGTSSTHWYEGLRCGGSCEPGRARDGGEAAAREEAEARARVRMLPFLIGRLNPAFVMRKCSFKVRVVMSALAWHLPDSSTFTQHPSQNKLFTRSLSCYPMTSSAVTRNRLVVCCHHQSACSVSAQHRLVVSLCRARGRYTATRERFKDTAKRTK